MQSFRHNQRVRVIQSDHPLRGQTGKVVRARLADDQAWVRMDETLPIELAAFKDALDARRNHIILAPEQCEEIPQ